MTWFILLRRSFSNVGLKPILVLPNPEMQTPKYQETVGKGLLEHIESETSFSYKKARSSVSLGACMIRVDIGARVIGKQF